MDSSASGRATLIITSDIKVNVATNPSGMSFVFPGGTVQLLATVVSAGDPDTTVNWTVNGMAIRWFRPETTSSTCAFRCEKRTDTHEAFLSLGCFLICWRFLRVDSVAV